MNYKIHAGSNTELIQQRLFDHGYRWAGGEKKILDYATYIFLNEYKDMQYYTGLNLEDFLNDEKKELTLTGFFEMFPEQSLSDKVRSKLQGKIDADTIKEICEMIDNYLDKQE